MDEEAYQRVVRYPEVARDAILLKLLNAVRRRQHGDRLGDVAEWLCRVAGELGWRLRDLAAGPAVGGDLAADVEGFVDELHRGGAVDQPRAFAQLARAWHALRAIVEARGEPWGEFLAAHAKGVAPLGPRWRPAPYPLCGESPPFALRFAIEGVTHRVAIEGTTVRVGDEEASYRSSGEAALAFEVNCAALEAAGLVAVPEPTTETPGILLPIVRPPPGELWFDGDALAAVTIFYYEDFYDMTRSFAPVGAYGEQVPSAAGPGFNTVHQLRRLFAHPLGRTDYDLRLVIEDQPINYPLAWLAERPELAAHVTRLRLEVSAHSDPVVRAQPLGAIFPNLRELDTTYAAWPRWSAAAFPALRRLTLRKLARRGGAYDYTPPLAEVAAEVAAKVPRLAELHVRAYDDEADAV